MSHCIPNTHPFVCYSIVQGLPVCLLAVVSNHCLLRENAAKQHVAQLRIVDCGYPSAVWMQSPGDVTLRACAFSTDTGLGSFAILPLAKHVSGKSDARSNRFCLIEAP